MSRLICWDVDHTLLETRRVGTDVFAEAFEAVTGHRPPEGAQAQGMLEPQLFAAACAARGIADHAALFQRFAELQASLYRQRADELRQRGRVLPGVHVILDALACRPDVVSTVLTGNTRSAGLAKLRAFGLDALLDLEVAAWGTDASRRSELAAVTWDRVSARYGTTFGPASTLVVGDSAADVAAARANGIRCIAAATGKADVDELAEAGAYRVLPDLADTDLALRVILGD